MSANDVCKTQPSPKSALLSSHFSVQSTSQKSTAATIYQNGIKTSIIWTQAPGNKNDQNLETFGRPDLPMRRNARSHHLTSSTTLGDNTHN
jgi:hypothetical protein